MRTLSFKTLVFTFLSILVFSSPLLGQTDVGDLPTSAEPLISPHNGSYNIDVESDVDWFRVELTDSVEYVFKVTDTSVDTYMYLYGPGNADGTLTGDQVGFNDDTNGSDPQITFIPEAGTGGYYYLRISQYGYKKTTGPYTLDISEPAAPSGYVTVTSPNGGEEWEKGSTQNITWDYDISDMVKIDLFKDLGFVDEIAITSCTGTYSWTIDTLITEGTGYSIKITSEADSTVFDESDGTFTISAPGDGNDEPAVATQITLPHYSDYDIIKDGDIDWYRVELSDSTDYVFSVSNSDIDTYMYLYGPGTADGTDTGTQVGFNDDTSGNDPQIIYTPATAGYYYIRVSEYSYKSDKGTGIYSLEAREIDLVAPEIISTVPDTNAVDVSIGSNITVSFNEEMDPATINSSTFNLFDGVTQITGSVSYLDSTATFVPDQPLNYSTLYSATVTTGVTDLEGNSLAAEYSWNFTTEAEPPYLSVTSPNGGENWTTNSTRTINWDYNIGDMVKIDLFKDLGFVDEIAITSCTGSYSWTIPDSLVTGNDYTVKITSQADPLVTDESDNYFSIVKSPFVTVLTPNGGETLKKDSLCSVTWDYNIYEQVKIYLYNDLGFVDEVAITSCTGNYQWNVSKDIPSGDKYILKITSEVNPAVTDSSDNYFSIYGLPVSPELISPADNDTLNTRLPLFQWTQSPDAVKYEITVDDSDAFDSPVINETITDTAYTAVTEFLNGRYYWRIRPVNAYGYGDYTSTWSFNIEVIPDKPVLSSPADQSFTSNQMPLYEWENDGNTDIWYIQIDDNLDFTSIEINDSTTAINYTPALNLPFGTYYWRVKARNEAGESAYSNEWIINIKDYPITPTLFTPADSTVTTVTTPFFSWSDEGDANSWYIQVDNDMDFSSPEVNDSSVVNNYTPGELSTGTYYWHVRSKNEVGDSGWTDTRILFIDDKSIELTYPDGGEILTKNTTYTITWIDNIGTKAKSAMKIELLKAGILISEIMISAPDLSYDWTVPDSLETGTDYSIRLTSITETGITDESDTYFTIHPPLPDTPALINPANSLVTGNQRPAFDWDEAANATGYEIQIDNNSDFSSVEINEVFAVNTYMPLIDLLFDIYHWRVRASNEAGESAWSESWSFTVLDVPSQPVLTAPADVSTVSTRTPAFEWDIIAEADSYHIIVDDSDLFDSPEIDSVLTANTYTPSYSKLGDQNTYYWKVCAENVAGTGEYSVIWAFYLDTTAIEDILTPNETKLFQNYPNPFNPETTISFDIARYSKVNLSVYSSDGALVSTLVNDNKNPGHYTVNWNGLSNNGKMVNSGMYYIFMKTENYSKAVKALMIK